MNIFWKVKQGTKNNDHLFRQVDEFKREEMFYSMPFYFLKLDKVEINLSSN